MESYNQIRNSTNYLCMWLLRKDWWGNWDIAPILSELSSFIPYMYTVLFIFHVIRGNCQKGVGWQVEWFSENDFLATSPCLFASLKPHPTIFKQLIIILLYMCTILRQLLVYFSDHLSHCQLVQSYTETTLVRAALLYSGNFTKEGVCQIDRSIHL